MTCSCGRTPAPDAVFCKCGLFVDRYAVPSDASVAPPPPPSGTGAVSSTSDAPALPGTSSSPRGDAGTWSGDTAPASRECPVEWCTGQVLPGTTACDAYGHPAVAEVTTSVGCLVLVLPDGTDVGLLEGVVLELGRHSPDPRIATALAPYDTVGRRQATIVLREGLIHLTHVGKTNPTYANGRLAAPTLTVAPPADVQFGRSVHLWVRWEETHEAR